MCIRKFHTFQARLRTCIFFFIFFSVYFLFWSQTLFIYFLKIQTYFFTPIIYRTKIFFFFFNFYFSSSMLQETTCYHTGVGVGVAWLTLCVQGLSSYIVYAVALKLHTFIQDRKTLRGKSHYSDKKLSELFPFFGLRILI